MGEPSDPVHPPRAIEKKSRARSMAEPGFEGISFGIGRRGVGVGRQGPRGEVRSMRHHFTVGVKRIFVVCLIIFYALRGDGPPEGRTGVEMSTGFWKSPQTSSGSTVDFGGGTGLEIPPDPSGYWLLVTGSVI